VTWQEDTQALTAKKSKSPHPQEHFLHLDNQTWRQQGRSLNKFPMAQATKRDEKHTMR